MRLRSRFSWSIRWPADANRFHRKTEARRQDRHPAVSGIGPTTGFLPPRASLGRDAYAAVRRGHHGYRPMAGARKPSDRPSICRGRSRDEGSRIEGASSAVFHASPVSAKGRRPPVPPEPVVMHGSAANENADNVGVDADSSGKYRETASIPAAMVPSN